MDLGLLYEFDCPQPWGHAHPWGQRTAERAIYKESVEQIVLADKMGFEAVWCVEHHFRENRSHMPSNEVVLGALSQVTKRIKLGFGVSLMPHEFIHPARIAEKVATVDLLSQGRAIWGMGRSTPMEQIAFHVDRDRSKEKMRAAARTVVGMWQEYYEEHSEFLDFPKRMVTPKPYQYPHPPAWMAANAPSGTQIAGEDGCGMLCFGVMQPLSKIKPVIDIYREAQKNAKPLTGVVTNKVGVYTLVHCAESHRDKFEQNRLWDSMWWWYRGLAEFMLKWEFADLPKAEQDAIFPLMDKHARGDFDITQFDREDMVIIGTPDECLNKLLKYEEAGVDQVLCYLNFGYLPQEAVLKSIELLGTYVIPELQKRGANRAASGVAASIRKAERDAIPAE